MGKPPLPKEHGSWAMFFIPLLLGMLIAPTWHWRSLALLVAAFGLFLAREPLATLIRTRRRARNDRAYWWRWIALYGGVALISGGWLVLAHELWWLIGLGGVGLALLGVNFWLVARRQEMSVIGELVGISALALGAPLAYYAASGQFDLTAALLWLINLLYFGGTVFYIKLKVRQQPRQPAPNHLSERLLKAKACLTYQTLALSVTIFLAALQQLPLLAPLALLPATVKAVYGAWQWQDRKSLNMMRLGVAEILHALTFTGLVVFAFT